MCGLPIMVGGMEQFPDSLLLLLLTLLVRQTSSGVRIV